MEEYFISFRPPISDLGPSWEGCMKQKTDNKMAPIFLPHNSSGLASVFWVASWSKVASGTLHLSIWSP